MFGCLLVRSSCHELYCILTCPMGIAMDLMLLLILCSDLMNLVSNPKEFEEQYMPQMTVQPSVSLLFEFIVQDVSKETCFILFV